MKNLIRKHITLLLSVVLIASFAVQLSACGSKTALEKDTAIESDQNNGAIKTDSEDETDELETELETETESETESEGETEDTETEIATLNAETGEEILSKNMENEEVTETQEQIQQPQTDPESQKNNLVTICIDPGHGGDSEGTKETYDGQLIMEKNLNYRIATSLKTYLERYANVRVVLTHGVESDMSLSGRIRYAVSNDADYFISVHVNSKSTDEVNSSGCMVLTGCSSYQPARTRVDSLYNTQMRMARSIISRLNGLGIPIANDWNTQNTGGILQRVNTVGETYPDGSQADFYGLLYNGTNAGLPTVIVEHAFLSNEGDYRNFLCTDAKLDALAKADAEGLADALSLR